MATQKKSSNETTEKSNRDLPGGRHGDIEGIIKNRIHFFTRSNHLEHPFAKTTTKAFPTILTPNQMYIK
jgi:hypothetical protein